MSRINSVCVVCAMSAWALGAWAPGAMAGSVQATLANGRAFDTLGANGTFYVNGYSEQNGVKNATATPTVVVNGIPINPLPTPPPLNRLGYYVSKDGTPILVPTGRFVKSPLTGNMVPVTVELGRTASVVNNVGPGSFGKSDWLKIANDQVTITSTTGQYSGEGSAFINPVGQRLLFARATVAPPLPPPAGAAAGRAVDPFFIPSSGSPIAYDPVLGDQVQLDAGTSGGAVIWAVDSSVFTSDSVDNFTQDGAPLDQTLWYLAAVIVVLADVRTIRSIMTLHHKELRRCSERPCATSGQIDDHRRIWQSAPRNQPPP